MHPITSRIICVMVVVLLSIVGCGPQQQHLTTVVVVHTPSPSVTITSTIEPTATDTPIATATATTTTLPTETATVTPSVTPSPTVEPQPIRHIVIVSIDGLRPDALDQADTPNLDFLRLKGAYQPSAKAVLPSVTLINHASMLSGMSPDKHGINWNNNDLDLGYINPPTLFTVAKEAGLETAMVVGKPKLEHIAIPNSVDTYIYAGFLDYQVMDRAIEVIDNDLPDILFIHLPDVDSAGHQMGWMSNTQLWMINSTDILIGDLWQALEARNYLSDTLLIITADHGGTGYKHGSDSDTDQTVPWLAVGPNVPLNYTITTPITIYDTAATTLYALDIASPSEWDGQPVLEIFGE